MSGLAGKLPDANALALLNRPIPRGKLTWESFEEEVPGIGQTLVAAPKSDLLNTGELGTLAVLAVSSYMGFFRAAEAGRALASAQEVAAKFGDTSDDNYRNSGAGEAFLRFARTYWSFRVIERQIVEEDCNTIACHILRWLDTMIAPLFFPIGPTPIPVKQRRADQRRYLERYSGRDMDIEGFLAANPILNAEALHQRGAGGGLGKFLVVCFVLGVLAFLVSRLFG